MVQWDRRGYHATPSVRNRTWHLTRKVHDLAPQLSAAIDQPPRRNETARSPLNGRGSRLPGVRIVRLAGQRAWSLDGRPVDPRFGIVFGSTIVLRHHRRGVHAGAWNPGSPRRPLDEKDAALWPGDDRRHLRHVALLLLLPRRFADWNLGARGVAAAGSQGGVQ